MRLKTILLILSLMAFISSLVGGFFHYSNLKLSAEIEASQLANNKIADTNNHLSSFLTEQLKPVRVLAGLGEIQAALELQTKKSLKEANNVLDLFTINLEVDVCYLMDLSGMTIASSNRLEQDSFVGKSFSFRPYFQQAVRGTPYTYMALGTASGKRGVYYSYPVLDRSNQQPIGVAVIKASVQNIEDQFIRSVNDKESLFLTDPHGIIFIASRKGWLYQSIWKLDEKNRQSVAASRQFGQGPWQWLGFKRLSLNKVVDNSGKEFILFEKTVEAFPGWRIIYLRDQPAPFIELAKPLLRTAGALIFPFFVFIIWSVFILYRKASTEIIQRKEAEQALKESEERYRTLYLNTPALLHSIDPSGKMVRVSDYWTEVLGYDRQEVIGRKVTDFMTQESKKYAEQVVIPKFLETGFCKDIAYQFIRKDGGIIDVLLSAIAERDSKGQVLRSIAVLVDITELKQVEKKLKQASAELSRYSLDLEKQVRHRTREISNILKYTPAVVYLKDTNGRYLLINSRFENLFNVKLEEIRGKKDSAIFDAKTADQFEKNDHQVLESREPIQVEEKVPLSDGEHTYLSIKFPLFEDDGTIIGLGGISTDITDLKKAQDQLRHLSSSILASQENERTAIARELHDELGQILTALRMDVVWLKDKLKGEQDDIADRSSAMSDLIDKTIDEVRNMAVRLRPGVLDDLGLIPALEWLVDDFEKHSTIPCTFKHDDIPQLDNAGATALYRITQEALTNVARHANAAHAEVLLEMCENELLLSVKDDGQGFDPEMPDEAEGLGISGIKERASLIEAEVIIESNPGSGSQIQVRFPLSAQDVVI